MSTSNIHQPSKRALEELQTASLRISPVASAERLWERHLLPSDRERLGGDLAKAYCDNQGTAGMWMRLRGASLQRAVIEVAKILGFLDEENRTWLIREIGEFADAEEAMAAAIAAGAFVLVNGPREAYWSGETIEVNWVKQNKLWDFLSTLARSSKAGDCIDSFSFGERANIDIVTKLKSRLTGMKAFPIDLADSIRVVGLGSQQLQLPREQIRIFERIGGDALREWTP